MVYVVITMMIPQQVVIVPLFLVVNQLGLTNTFWALVIPWYASPFIVFALTQFFADLPPESGRGGDDRRREVVSEVLTHVVVPNRFPVADRSAAGIPIYLE